MGYNSTPTCLGTRQNVPCCQVLVPLPAGRMGIPLASGAWTNGVRGIVQGFLGISLASGAWTNGFRGLSRDDHQQRLICGLRLPMRPGRINFVVISGVRTLSFGSACAGIEVRAIFTHMKKVKIVPLGRFAQCYCSIFFQFALGLYGTG